MVTLEDFREYSGIPPDLPDGKIKRYLDAARSKARTAGVPDFQDNAEYDLFLLALADHFYNNRGMAYSGSYQATAQATAQAMIDSFVLTLRHAREDNEGVLPNV